MFLMNEPIFIQLKKPIRILGMVYQIDRECP
ncbi:MAG: hypothetical protein OJF49_003974 [Ktedonobacterales bacterium]|jgi:hypothetical protein|nr:MAG: hypothetical protein OJF49_003974 [Ktedonobacterales bacterium]